MKTTTLEEYENEVARLISIAWDKKEGMRDRLIDLSIVSNKKSKISNYTNKITKIRIARMAGLHGQNYGAIDSGKTDISLENAIKFSIIHGVSLEEFVYGEGGLMGNYVSPVEKEKEELNNELLAKEIEYLKESREEQRTTIDMQKKMIAMMEAELQKCKEDKMKIGA